MKGCLCIHGFTGAPYEVEPLVSYLQERTDWVLKTPTLPGHGETPSLKGIEFSEWIAHAENELRDLLEECSEVYIIGFSMGGLIAAYLASRYPVEKLVLLSAAAHYLNPRQMLLDVKGLIADAIRGEGAKNELFIRYRKKVMETPIAAALQFRKLVRYIRPLLEKITIPVLIVQGECDGMVPVKSAVYIYEKVRSRQKELCFMPCSKHLICHGEEFPELAEVIENFLMAQTKTSVK
ncbi:alpha/beta hydrolase [Metabacillus indicus]|uniref:alpha/beta hydrolase n=1 Tax=Metabacillus indicus TaxID=246786 RepID=UPI002491A3A1|nr:alpha/beta fold hydrolase [Metabacillus indicus]